MSELTRVNDTSMVTSIYGDVVHVSVVVDHDALIQELLDHVLELPVVLNQVAQLVLAQSDATDLIATAAADSA